MNKRNKQEKGTASLIAYIFYIMIGLVILTTVVISGINIIDKHKQKNNYEQMLQTINKLDQKIIETTNQRFQKQEFIINNPEELVIDCENNKIKGNILYDYKFRTDQNVNINNIILYKKLNKIYFEKNINNKINLNCESITLNKGKNTLNISYFNYNVNTEKIEIDIISRKEITNNWYNENWEYRQLLIIDANLIEGSLNNFPIPINLTSLNLQKKAKQDGSDIIFTSSDGSTKLSREIEDYNFETGRLMGFVKIPNLDENNTHIYMYYGNSSANQENDATTWDDDFAAVYHMNNSALDSTQNNKHGAIIDSLNISEDKFGSNNAFNFTTGKIKIPKPFEQPNLEQTWTVDAWYNIEDKSNYQSILSSGEFNRGLYIIFRSARPLLYLNGEANDYYIYGDGSNININNWEKISFKFKNIDGYRKIYKNGIDISTSGPNKTSTPSGITENIYVGEYFRGSIDELRISTIIRSENWTKTEFNTFNKADKLLTIGELQIR